MAVLGGIKITVKFSRIISYSLLIFTNQPIHFHLLYSIVFSLLFF